MHYKMSALATSLQPKTYFGKLLDEIRILLTHILRVSAEYSYSAVRQLMHLERMGALRLASKGDEMSYLSTFAIVLVFASEPLVLEPIEHFTDGFRWFGEHGLQGHTRRQLAVLSQPTKSVLQESWNHLVI